MSERSSPDIDPCPFCRGTMQFRKALWPSDGCVDAIIHAFPTQCGMVEFSDGSIDESIIAKWNTRAPLQPATPTAGEPVAYRWRYDDETKVLWDLRIKRPKFADDPDVICEPLYTRPATGGDAVAGDARLNSIIDRMAKLYNSAATHEGGYAISIGPLFDFIQELKALRSDVAGDVQAATTSTPEGLADFVRRCRAYLEDCPGDGGHSDAAGSTAYELIEEAIEHCIPDVAQPSTEDK